MILAPVGQMGESPVALVVGRRGGCLLEWENEIALSLMDLFYLILALFSWAIPVSLVEGVHKLPVTLRALSLWRLHT